MPSPEINEFARTLVQQVRDAAVQSSDRRLQAYANSPVVKRWAKAINEETTESVAKTLIPDIVDDTIFYLLRAIDQEMLRLTFSASNGNTVDLTTAGRGELGGWFMGTDGWRSRYARERFVDDFADLNPSK